VQVIAIDRACDAELLRQTMRMGVREFLISPFSIEPLLEALQNVAAVLERKPAYRESTSQVFSFVPAKAGSGASTLGINISAALARQSKERVLLSDFDLNSGMVQFMLKLKNENSALEAIEHAIKMDENLWPQLVTPL